MTDWPRLIHYTATGQIEVAPVSSTGTALPASLIVAPGIYTWAGQNWDLTSGGLYRFSDYSTTAAQRIVPDASDPTVFFQRLPA